MCVDEAGRVCWGVCVCVCVGGVGLLSRIHFPPDHNAIIVGLLYCASQRAHTDTHTQIHLTLFRI